MSNAITRKDIISDEAIQWGEDYVKFLQPAVDKNKEFVQSILALNEANNGVRLAKTQKELADATKKANDQGEKALTVWKEQNQLEQALISTKRKNQLATESTAQALIKERVELQATNKAMKQAALEQLGMVSAYTKLNNARTEAKNKLRDLLAAEEKNNAEIRKAQKEFNALEAKVRKADAAVNDFTKNVGNYPFQNVTSGIKNLIGAFGINTGISLFAGIMKGAFDTIKQFEQGVADLSAITGATGKDLDFLKGKAIDLGKGVEGGAIAVVEAYKLIASAKPELLDNVQALNQVTAAAITLSQAAGISLPDAATALTDALNQFNLPADQAGNFIDALANGAKFGAAEIPQITEALLKFGAVARNSNINIKESTALIELLAENGLKGADAGTALRNVLLKISAPDALPLKAKEAITALGISMETLKDRSIPIQQKLELLRPILKDNAALVKVFGLENVVAAQNIIGHTDRLKELTSKMDELGTAQEQANIRMNTLQGDLTKLSSTYDSFVLSLTKGKGALTDFFRGAIQLLTETINDWKKLNDTIGDYRAKNATKTALNELEQISAAEKKYIAILKTKNDTLLLLEKTKKLNPDDKGIDKKIETLKSEIEITKTKLELEKKISETKKQSKANDAITRNIDLSKESNTLTLKNIQLREKEAELIKKINDNSGENGNAKVWLEAKRALQEVNKELDKNNAKIGENNVKIRYNNTIINQVKKKPVAAPVATDTVATVSTLDETTKEKNARLALEKKFTDEYLRLLRKRNDDEFKLMQFRYDREIYYNELIMNDDKKSIEDRVNAYLEIEQIREASAKSALENELRNNAISRIEEEKRALESSGTDQRLTKSKIDELYKRSNTEISEMLKTGKIREGATQEEILAFEKFTLEIEKLTNKSAEDKQKIIDSGVAIVQKKIDAELLAQDTKLNKVLESENTLYQAEIAAANGKHDLIEKAEEEHQRRLYEIKKQFSVDGLKLQIDALEKELADNDKKDVSEQISAEKRAELANKLQKYKTELSGIETQEYIKDVDEREAAEKEFYSQIKDLATKLKDSLVDFTNAIFEAKISRIDAEIQANDDYYNHEIELAGNNQHQKDLLTAEAEKKRLALEKKKRKAEYDQAVFNKAVQAAQIIGSTSLAVISALAQVPKFDFGISASAIAAVYAGIGAVQLATLLATPLPKYKLGRKDGPEEFAVTGDGGVHEVLSNPDGSNPILTPKTPTLTYLKEGQMVHKSVGAYEDYVKASILSGINIENNKVSEYKNISNDFVRLEGKIEQGIEKGFKKAKININNQSSASTDIGYQLWRFSNINWSR